MAKKTSSTSSSPLASGEGSKSENKTPEVNTQPVPQGTIDLGKFSSRVQELIAIPEKIEDINNHLSEVIEIRSALLLEKERIKLKLKPQSRLRGEKVVGRKRTGLPAHEKAMEKIRLSEIDNTLIKVEQAFKELSAKIKKLAVEKTVKLKLDGVRLKSLSDSYMKRNLPNLQKRIANIFAEISKTTKGMEKIKTLKAHIDSGEQEKFLEDLFNIIKDKDDAVFTLATGLKSIKELLVSDIGNELKKPGILPTNNSGKRFFPKSVSDAFQNLSKPQTTPVNKKPVLRKAKPGK
ncbi:MAG: hypothetical protein HYV28_04885 [Ignavibacteriales bacterium]|nr:hypothetical protein [Ignavibacteriales bacterium]